MVRWFAFTILFSLSAFSKERVVTLSPALSELLFQLGKGNEVVGVSNFSDFPEEARLLPRIGELFFPNLEKILKLHPTYLLNDAFTQNPQFLSAARSLGLPLKTVRIHSADALFSESKGILKEVFHQETSEELARTQEVYKRWITSQKQFTYLFFTWVNPPILASRNTFFSNLFEVKGGTNLIPNTVNTPYIQVSDEWIVQQTPKVIFFLQNDASSIEEVKRASQRWWPGRSFHAIGLDPKVFARTSLSPVLNIGTLEDKL